MLILLFEHKSFFVVAQIVIVLVYAENGTYFLKLESNFRSISEKC